MLLLNTLLSEHFLNGNIDLSSKDEIFDPDTSESENEEPEIPEILNPEILLGKISGCLKNTAKF